VLPNGKPATFLIATLDGTLAGWNGGTNAVTLVDNSSQGAGYLGLAVAGNPPQLYVANWKTGNIDVFDSSFNPVTLQGNQPFYNSHYSAGFSPSNVQRFGHALIVSYSLSPPSTTGTGGTGLAGPGTPLESTGPTPNGFVDIFDSQGSLLRILGGGGELNSPTAIAAVSPAEFGDFSNALLVANSGNGTVNAFDLLTGDFLGVLNGTDGNPLTIQGLKGLQFGNGGDGGSPTTLFFTAGSATHGVVGSIRPAPATPAK
jgi:uncharacterized protein (TIGR03118 family)